MEVNIFFKYIFGKLLLNIQGNNLTMYILESLRAFLLLDIISKHAKFEHVIISKHVLSLLIRITFPIHVLRAWFLDMNFV